MRKGTYFNILLHLFILSNIGLAQGYPSGNTSIVNYEKEEYQASVSNWDIIENEIGFIYMANNGGVLEYNGLDWRVLPMPNKTIVRSVEKGKEGRIYAGGQDEIGFFDLKSGVFTSIRNKIPGHLLPLEDIWDLQVVKEEVYFRSKNLIYSISNDTTKVIYTGNALVKLIAFDNQVFFVDEQDGLYTIVDQKRKIFLTSDQLGGRQIVDVVFNKNLLYVLTRNALFKYENGVVLEIDTELETYFTDNRISCGVLLENKLAIGTAFGGICILNEDNKLDRIISIKEGLQNNSINALTTDKNKNLWSASANGVDCIYFNSRKSIIYPDGDLKGSVYDMLVYNDKMYYATNNGLYVQDLNKKGVGSQAFRLLEGTAGQVWGLDIIGEDLLMAHDQGAFIIKENKVERISPTIGAWKFVQASSSNHMYIGTYFGVELYEKINKEWKYIKRYKGLDESSRILVRGNDNNLWVSHPYRGVYLLNIDTDFNLGEIKHFTGHNGLPSNQLNYIFDLDGKMVVAAERGIFDYDPFTNRFTSNDILNEWIGPLENIRHLQSDNFNRLWFIKTNEVGYIQNNEKILIPELVGHFIGGFEYLYIHDENHVFACSDKGVFNLNLKKDSEQLVSNLNVLSVQITDSENNISNIDIAELNHPISLGHTQNSICVKFSSSLYAEDVLYSHRINDGQWSPWTLEQKVELINIKDGEYDLQIKTNADAFIESEPFRISLIVNPPWYRSILAYLGYVLFLFLVVVLLLAIPKRKYQKDKEVLVIEKQKTEAEVERLKNEQLQIEIEHQNAALASSTLHLVQKNTALNKVRAELDSVRKKTKEPEIKKELKGVLSLLLDDSRLEDDWDNFSIHFDKVHADFLKRLKSTHPALSPKDQKLAAYLRMNLSTKEIAPLLNISVRGVEISRYRLRKKLNIDSGTNLNDWMMTF